MKPKGDKLIDDGFLPVILVNPIKTAPYKVREDVVKFVKQKAAQGVPKTTIAGMLSQEKGVIISTRTIDRIIQGEYDSVIKPKGPRSVSVPENPQGIPFPEAQIQKLIVEYANKRASDGIIPRLSDEEIAVGIREDVKKLPWPSTWPGMTIKTDPTQKDRALIKSHGVKPISRATVQRLRKKLIQYYDKNKRVPFDTTLNPEQIRAVIEALKEGRRSEPKNKAFIERYKSGRMSIEDQKKLVGRVKPVIEGLARTKDEIRISEPSRLVEEYPRILPSVITFIPKTITPEEEEARRRVMEEIKELEKKLEGKETGVGFKEIVAYAFLKEEINVDDLDTTEVKELGGIVRALTDEEKEWLIKQTEEQKAFNKIKGFEVAFEIRATEDANKEKIVKLLEKLDKKRGWIVLTGIEMEQIAGILAQRLRQPQKGKKGGRGKGEGTKTTGVIGTFTEVSDMEMEDFNIGDIMWDVGGKQYTTRQLQRLLAENPYFPSSTKLGTTRSEMGRAARAILLEGIQEARKAGCKTGREIAKYMNTVWLEEKQKRGQIVPLTAFVNVRRKRGEKEAGKPVVYRFTVIAPRAASALYRAYIERENPPKYAPKTKIAPPKVPYTEETFPKRKATGKIVAQRGRFKSVVDEWKVLPDEEKATWKKKKITTRSGKEVTGFRAFVASKLGKGGAVESYDTYGVMDVYENPGWVPTTRLGTLLEELDIEENPTFGGTIMSEASRGLMLLVGAAGAGLAINYGVKLGSKYLSWFNKGWAVALTGAVSFILVSWLERMRFLRNVPEDIWTGAKTVSALFIVGGLIGQFFPNFAAMFMPTYPATSAALEVGCEGAGCGEAAWGGVSFEDASPAVEVETITPPSTEEGTTFAAGLEEVGQSVGYSAETIGQTEYSTQVLPAEERSVFASEESDEM